MHKQPECETNQSSKLLHMLKRTFFCSVFGLLVTLLLLFFVSLLVNAGTIPPDMSMIYCSVALFFGSLLTSLLGARSGKALGALLSGIALFILLWVVGALTGSPFSIAGLIRCGAVILLSTVIGVFLSGMKKGK